MDEQSGGQAGDAAPEPRNEQPGGESTPEDTEGAGPVGLQDRTRQRGVDGSPDTSAPAANQGKAEPIPVTPGQADPNAPLEPPALEDMNVGAADPQLPGHPLAAGAGQEPGAAPTTGPQNPASGRGGTSHHAPGMQGRTGPDEAVETDVVASAARMGRSARDRSTENRTPDNPVGDPGDAKGVPAASPHSSSGTSEEHDVVRGARTPTHDS